MKKLEELGTVITSDILIIGGGLAGLTASIFAKEKNPELDVLIVESATTGRAGRAPKAGHGTLALSKQSVEAYVEWATRFGGQYLNDQDLLRQYGNESLQALEILDSWGATIPKGRDGKIISFPSDLGFGMTGLDNDMTMFAKDRALEHGVRIIDKTQTFDFLKDGDRVVGAIGMSLLDGTFYIFKAKAVAFATGACAYKVSGLFRGYGDAIAAAYNAGAEMRNAEFFTQFDMINRRSGEKVYGCHQLIFNKNGENISDKYALDAAEVTYPLILGMKKEIEEGRGPLYADLTIENYILKIIGNKNDDLGDGVRRIGPSKRAWQEHIVKKNKKLGIVQETKPEVSVTVTMTTSPVSVDHQMRTSVPGLWAVGSASFWGQAYMGWVHGDGTGNAVKSAMHAGPDLAEYASAHEQGKVNAEEVATLKEKLFAPLNREDGELPKCYFDRIADIVTDFKYCILKTDESMKEALARIEEIHADLPGICATDWHEVSKCREVEGMLTCAQIAFRASLERKESRGLVWKHNRVDYPETDNKNWLKWIVLKKGDGGVMTVRFDPVPIWNYKYQPEGYVKPAQMGTDG